MWDLLLRIAWYHNVVVILNIPVLFAAIALVGTKDMWENVEQGGQDCRQIRLLM